MEGYAPMGACMNFIHQWCRRCAVGFTSYRRVSKLLN